MKLRQKYLKNYAWGILALLLMASPAIAQKEEAGPIIDSVMKIQSGIFDYRAEVEIEVDVDFIKMPVKHATILFKKPDKVRFQSDDFLLLPKKSVGINLNAVLQTSHSLLLTGSEVIDGKDHWIIKIIPDRPFKGLVISTAWIDKEDYAIRRIENFTRDGVYLLDMKYDTNTVLPHEIVVSFEVEKFSIPLNFIGKSAEIDKKSLKEDSIKTGRIFLRFSNYEVNSGIQEDEFAQE